MFGLNLVKNALAALAGSITGLASTVDQINAGLRQRAALDGPDAAPLTLPAPSGMPVPASTLAQDGPEPAKADPSDPTPQNAARNGRRKAAGHAG